MTEPGYLRYYDPRYGDTYEIYLDREGNFISAARHIGAIGQDPIFYDHVSDVPTVHQAGIRDLIRQHQPKDGN